MKLEFATARQEQEFDHCAQQWIRKYRSPSAEDMALIMVRAHENNNGATPSISAFERAYRELVAEGRMSICNEKYTEPVVVKRKHLTVEEYRLLAAQEVARRFMRDPFFAADVNKLISEGKI
jgi:hypothetical protein